MCVRIAMAGWLHGVFVGDWLFVFPLCGFSLSLFCNYVPGSSPMLSSALWSMHERRWCDASAARSGVSIVSLSLFCNCFCPLRSSPAALLAGGICIDTTEHRLQRSCKQQRIVGVALLHPTLQRGKGSYLCSPRDVRRRSNSTSTPCHRQHSRCTNRCRPQHNGNHRGAGKAINII